MSSVLIVDDDARIRELLARWLTAAAHETHEASDAETALARLDAGGCDVVLCDVVMPGRGGLWLVEQARARHPAVAVVLATGLERVPPSTSLAGNVVDYLVKPFEREGVLAAVERAQAWHEAAVQKTIPGGAEDVLATWLRRGRSQGPDIK